MEAAVSAVVCASTPAAVRQGGVLGLLENKAAGVLGWWGVAVGRSLRQQGVSAAFKQECVRASSPFEEAHSDSSGERQGELGGVFAHPHDGVPALPHLL